MFSTKYVQAVLERMIKTFAQALLAVLTANGTGLIDTDWVGVLSTAGMASLLSLLSSLSTSSGPSLVGETLDTPGRVQVAHDPAEQGRLDNAA